MQFSDVTEFTDWGRVIPVEVVKPLAPTEKDPHAARTDASPQASGSWRLTVHGAEAWFSRSPSIRYG